MVQEGKHETNRVYLLNNLLGSNVRNSYEDSQGLRSLCSRGSGKRKMKSIFCTAGGRGGGEKMDFTQLIFKHHSFIVLKKTNCLMYGCFKDNAVALFIIVAIFI